MSIGQTDRPRHARPPDETTLAPGAVIPATEPIPLTPGRRRLRVRVVNAGDRPVQVGSHVHFPAANDALLFDREAAWGTRLDVPAGTSVRFEPGVDAEVGLVALAGARFVPGLRSDRGGALAGARAEQRTQEDL
jgi:urease subunit beta